MILFPRRQAPAPSSQPELQIAPWERNLPATLTVPTEEMQKAYTDLLQGLRGFGIKDEAMDRGTSILGRLDLPLEGKADQRLSPAELYQAYMQAAAECQRTILDETPDQKQKRESFEALAGNLKLDLPHSFLIPTHIPAEQQKQWQGERDKLIGDLRTIRQQTLAHFNCKTESDLPADKQAEYRQALALAVYQYFFSSPEEVIAGNPKMPKPREILYALNEEGQPAIRCQLPLQTSLCGKGICLETAGLLHAALTAVGLNSTFNEPITFRSGARTDSVYMSGHLFISVEGADGKPFYIDPSAEISATLGVHEGFNSGFYGKVYAIDPVRFYADHTFNIWSATKGDENTSRSWPVFSSQPYSAQAATFFSHAATLQNNGSAAVNAHANRLVTIARYQETDPMSMRQVARLRYMINPKDPIVGRIFQDALKLCPDDGSAQYGRSALRTEILQDRAMMASQAKDYAAMVANLKQMARLDPFQLWRSSMFQQVMTGFKPGTIPAPFDQEVLRVFAQVEFALQALQLMQTATVDQMEASRHKMLTWDPEGAYLAGINAFIAEKHGDIAAAKDQMNLARQRAPEDLHLWLADIDFKIRNNDGKAAYLLGNELRKRFPENLSYRLFFTRAALAAGEIEVADREIDQLQKFADLPQTPLLEIRGERALIAGDLNLARELLVAAAKCYPENRKYRVRMLLGRLEAQSGNLAKAKELFEQALKNFPGYPAALDGLKQIQNR